MSYSILRINNDQIIIQSDCDMETLATCMSEFYSNTPGFIRAFTFEGIPDF